MTVRSPFSSPLLVFAIVLLVLLGGGASTASAQRDPDRPERAFAEAYKLYSDQLYEQAIERFDAFRTRYPDHVSAAEALYYEAESALAVGYLDQAVGLFREFQQTYPGHPLAFQARLALGQYFYRSENYERALETLNQVLADNPTPEVGAKALYWMGESSLKLGRTDNAIAYYRRAAEEYRDTDTAPIALYAIAYTHVQQDQLDEAARAFELLGARYPDSPYARNLGLALAEVYYALGDFQRVVNEIDRRMNQLEPAVRDQARFLLAESHNQLRHSEEAILNYRPFTEGAKLGPYYRPALFGLAWNYYLEGVHQWAADNFALAREGNTDDLAMRATYYEAVNRVLADQKRQALPLFASVADQWPESLLADHALYEKGMVEYELRLWSDANTTFSRLLNEYGNSNLRGDALRQRGYTSIALAEFENAFRDFDRAVALDAAPQELKDEIIFQKAWLQYRTEDYASAAPAFTSLYESNRTAPKASEALFWAAESNYQLGKFGTSTKLFSEYLRDFSSGDKVDAAHYALGWSHFRQGQYGEAAREFNTFLTDYRDESDFVPYRTDAQMRLADSYYAMKRYSDAIRYYQRLADSGEDYALYQIGQSHNNAGNTSSAISAFRNLLQRSPGSDYREEAQYTLGYLYFQTQNYDQAIEEYNKLIRTFPRDPLAAKAQYGIGDAYFNDGQLDRAVQAYTKVLENYPNSPFVGDAAAGVQYALLGLQDEDRAEAVIDSFATANPNSPILAELRFRQAEVKFQSGRSAEALADFQNVLRLHPDTPQAASANYYLGTIYAEQGRNADAETALRRVMNASEGSKRAEAADELGKLLLQQGRNQEALEAYRRMEQLGEAAKARYGQGQALLALGRTAEAEALLADAAASGTDTPDSLPSKLGLARVYEQQGRTGEATRLYREVVNASRDETGAEALYHLGNLLLKQGDARGTISELSRMETLYIAYPNWLVQGYLLQARAFRNLGDNGSAARLYDRVIEEFRGTRYAEQAAQEKEGL